MWRQPGGLKLICSINEHVDWWDLSEERKRPFPFLALVTAMHHLMMQKRLSASLFAAVQISVIVFAETKRVMTHMI